MRNGFLGAIVALAASAGLSWGQALTSAQIGPSPIIQPQFGDAPGGYPEVPGDQPDPGQFGGPPPGLTGYPPPANPEGFDPNGPNGNYQPRSQVPYCWFNAEYLMYFQKGARFGAPLATTGSTFGSGVPGQSDTQILYGNRDVNFNYTNGMRLSGGWWLDAERRWGIELGGFVLEQRSQAFRLGSDDGGAPLIARPFYDPYQNVNGSVVVASPNIGSGGIAIATTSKTWGAEGNLLLNLYRSAPDDKWGYNLTVLGGFRYAEHTEMVSVITNQNANLGSSITFLNQTYTAGTSDVTTSRVLNNGIFGQTQITQTISTDTVNLGTLDQISVRNEFYGANTGINQEIRYGNWTLGFVGKVAFGVMDQTVMLNGGSSLTTQSNQTVTNTVVNAQNQPLLQTTNQFILQQHFNAIGGVIAQSNDIGKFHRDVYSILPEGTLNVSYHITPAIVAFVGYDVTYFTHVVRAANEVTGQVNQGLLPTSIYYGTQTPVPTVPVFRETDFWVQGVTVGLNFRY